MISHNFFRISVLNQFVFRGPGSNAHKKRRWTDDGLDSTTTRLSSRDVRYFSIMGSMGLCMGSICARKDINWRAFCISRLQGMFWFDSFSLVLGIIGIHVDKIQNQVSASVLFTLFSRKVLTEYCSYIYLFDFDPRNVDTPIDIFNDAVDETLIFLVCMLMYYKADSGDMPLVIPPRVYPFLLILYTM